jgi:hypothetical protein
MRKESSSADRHFYRGRRRRRVAAWKVMRTRIMYVELKTGHNDNGPAWIGRVSFSKTGQTIYYREKSLRRIHGGGVQGNYRDVETGEEYWVSGVKRNQEDRHWAGTGAVEIDPDVEDEYRRMIDA